MAIDINPANKGKFTATKKATGKSTEELTHSKNPLTRKRAIFAQNAKKFEHEDGSASVGYNQSKDAITKARQRAGGSNVGKYNPNQTFAGPSGGAPRGSYPIGDEAHAKSALKLAHNAPNPSGIKAAVYRKYPNLKKQNNGTSDMNFPINKKAMATFAKGTKYVDGRLIEVMPAKPKDGPVQPVGKSKYPKGTKSMTPKEQGEASRQARAAASRVKGSVDKAINKGAISTGKNDYGLPTGNQGVPPTKKKSGPPRFRQTYESGAQAVAPKIIVKRLGKQVATAKKGKKNIKGMSDVKMKKGISNLKPGKTY